MAWFLNHYHCDDCGADWEDEWSCCCDDECPVCGSGDWSPVESDDVTFVVEPEDDKLEPRILGGGAGGCPVLVFAMTPAIYVDDRTEPAT